MLSDPHRVPAPDPEGKTASRLLCPHPITMTLGIGLCEESGMLISMLNSSLKNVPAAMIPYVIAFVGTVGNIASDTAMVVIPPMAAIVYMGVGKHPVVGMMVGYAGAHNSS